MKVLNGKSSYHNGFGMGFDILNCGLILSANLFFSRGRTSIK